ncbi:hypothetical protein QFC22_001013 [Naganishia vaughanmartiniae]|uniref:Uncharacterized protein n=1 Tax=Naganishia vaughanmartiniae TaxID=1424756 RepID=A0ACC2XLF0_9TREE|nr:hypothetical protein QFC22_001013 [Naganishia vaughanmartiniae]
MSGNNRNPPLTPNTQPPSMGSLSDDSILDTTFEERGVAHLARPPHRARVAQYTPITHGNAQAASSNAIHARRRLPQLSPEGVYIPGDPRQLRADDSTLVSERTAPRRLWTRQSPHMPPAIEQATRTPSNAMMAGPSTTTPTGMGPVTPPVRYDTGTGDDSWLPNARETFTRPAIHTSFDLGANFGYYQPTSVRPYIAPAGFRPFPLPPPPRQDVASGPLNPWDGMRRSVVTQGGGLRDTDTSDMDFSMASFTSPTHLSYPHQPVQTSRLPPPATNNRIQGPQAPPTIESIQREIAYWQRNQAPLPSPHDIPALPNAGSHAPYITPDARAARQNRDEPSNISSMEGGSMDISVNSIDASVGEAVAFTSVARAHIIQQSQSVQRARRHSHSSRIEEGDSSILGRQQVQDITDSSMSSRNGSDRPLDISDRPPYRVDNRIDEQPELDYERDPERNAEYDRSIIDTASEAERVGEEEEEDEGEESNASSTRHLRDDELEVLILENLGFHGDLTRPGKIVPPEVESTHSDVVTDSDDHDNSQIDYGQTGLESETDELAIRSTEKPPHSGATQAKVAYTGNKKRKRVPRMADKLQSKKKISEFDVEKRRKQWLSEKEDRALRRGPLMTLSEQEFKENMLDAAEWKQLINHELSATAWKYMPIVGPGFLPSVHLAELGHSSAHPRSMPRTGMPSGPLHSTHLRARNVNMAALAAAHEAIAYGQAGEEYGIRVLPLASQFQEVQRQERLDFLGGDDFESNKDGQEHTDSESDTEMAEDSLDKAEREDSERKRTKTYLEGSFGRLAVDDLQRAMLQDPSRM